MGILVGCLADSLRRCKWECVNVAGRRDMGIGNWAMDERNGNETDTGGRKRRIQYMKV